MIRRSGRARFEALLTAPKSLWHLFLVALLLDTALGAPVLHARPAEKESPLALGQLSARVAEDLVRQGAEAPLALWVHGDAPELARAFATVLSSELARRKLAPLVIEAPTPAQAETTARDEGARSIARITLSLGNGLLQARGDLLGTWVNFWSGKVSTRPLHPAAALEASTDADAHALALASASLARPLANATQTGEVRLVGAILARLGQWTSALGAGDLDADGKDEILALTEAGLFAFSGDGQLLARRDYRAALPLASAPPREPFGALTVLANPVRVAYFPANRARGEELSLEGRRAGFRVLGALEEPTLGAASALQLTGKLVPGQAAFAPELRLGPEAAFTAPRPFTTASVFTGPSGPELLVVGADGRGVWRGGLGEDAPSVELDGLGAATALADVDGDGVAELVTTEPTFRPSPEVLRVLRSPATHAPAGDGTRYREELPRGRAMQVVGAHLDADLAQALVVALWVPDGTTELWVFRRMK